MSKKKKGWKYLLNAIKYHYFNNEFTSLCGKWGAFSLNDLDDTNHKSPDNCKACIKKHQSLFKEPSHED